MLNWIIAFSLKNRALVLIGSIAVMVYGVIQLRQMPVDVFPELNRPTVTKPGGNVAARDSSPARVRKCAVSSSASTLNESPTTVTRRW